MINTEILANQFAEKLAVDYINEQCYEGAMALIKENLIALITKDVDEKDKPRAELFDVLFKAIKPHEKKFKSMIEAIWEEERKIIVANIKKMKKAWMQKDRVDEILYPSSVYTKKIADNSEAIIVETIASEGPRVVDQYNFDMVFDVDDPHIKKWLETYIPVFSKSLEAVNVEKLRATLIEGINAGEGIPELARRVNETYANWYKYRSMNIARSETLRAANKAALEVYRQSGVVKKKIWITYQDNRTCFPKNTKIITRSGRKNIQDIKIGEQVLTHNGWQKVRKTMKQKYNGEMIRVKVSNGKKVVSTADHPFYVINKNWVKAKDLIIGDCLKTNKDETVNVISIQNFKLFNPNNFVSKLFKFLISLNVFHWIRMPTGQNFYRYISTFIKKCQSHVVYNFEVENAHTYYANGILVHNCPHCEQLDGQIISLEKNFFDLGDVSKVSVDGKEQKLDINYTYIDAPPLHAQCLLPGSTCKPAGNIIAGLRAWYRGKAIEFTFSDNSRVSVTPNHLFLTPYGFAAAQFLCEGDYMLYCPRFEGAFTGDPNNNNSPTAIDKIISSLAESGGVSIRSVPVAPEYLHGDGWLCNGNIDIIRPNSHLWNTDKTMFCQSVSQDALSTTNPNHSFLFSQGDFVLMLKRLASAADGIMGGLRQSNPLFLARFEHSKIHRSTSSPGFNTSLEDSISNNTAADMESFCKSFFGFSSTIKPTNQISVNLGTGLIIIPRRTARDSSLNKFFTYRFAIGFNQFRNFLKRQSRFIKTKQIINIKVFPYVGHVYDLQTSSSLYTSSVIMSNCRCSVSAYIEG